MKEIIIQMNHIILIIKEILYKMKVTMIQIQIIEKNINIKTKKDMKMIITIIIITTQHLILKIMNKIKEIIITIIIVIIKIPIIISIITLIIITTEK